jgi:tetratricopeptide (TPR) repeat protein
MDTKRFENALHAIDSGHVAEALSEFDSLADLAPDAQEKSSMLMGQASCLMHLGLIAEARERWSRSAACWTNLYTEYFDLILCTLEGRRNEAIAKIREFLSHRDELIESGDQNLYSDAAERLGYLLFDLGRYEEAIKPFTGAAETAETEARRAEMKLYLGMCYIQVGNFRAAEQTLLESLPADANDPLWPRVQFQRGSLYFQRGAYTQAKAVLEQFLLTDRVESDLFRPASELLAEVERRLLNEGRRIV